MSRAKLDVPKATDTCVDPPPCPCSDLGTAQDTTAAGDQLNALLWVGLQQLAAALDPVVPCALIAAEATDPLPTLPQVHLL